MRKQHEENFQGLDFRFWCFATFSSKLPDVSLGADGTRLKTQLEIEPMFADAKREGCGIAWKLKLLCWANEDCCQLVPLTETKGLVHLHLNPVEKLVAMMYDIFRWCVMQADLYELKLCRFLYPLNCATKFSGVPSLFMGISEEIEDVACVASVYVGFGSKERPTNGIFGVFPARKMGREPKNERGGGGGE